MVRKAFQILRCCCQRLYRLVVYLSDRLVCVSFRIYHYFCYAYVQRTFRLFGLEAEGMAPGYVQSDILGELALYDLLFIYDLSVRFYCHPSASDGAVIGIDGTDCEPHPVIHASEVEVCEVLPVSYQCHLGVAPESVPVDLAAEPYLSFFRLLIVDASIVEGLIG